MENYRLRITSDELEESTELTLEELKNSFEPLEIACALQCAGKCWILNCLSI